MTVALVTGGNGFLGTAVIDALIAQGITVVCVDPRSRTRRTIASAASGRTSAPPQNLGGC